MSKGRDVVHDGAAGARVLWTTARSARACAAVFPRLSTLCIPLALAAGIALLCSAARLNQSYLTPSGEVKIDQARLGTAAGQAVALSFDDGPDSTYTPQVLEILDQYKIKATFFVVGNRVVSHGKLVKALAASGHEIGNHTYAHPNLKNLSSLKITDQLKKTDTALSKLGITAHWFRPPYGEFSSAAVKAASALGLQTILWSVDPRDWAQPGVEKIEKRVLGSATPGAVILMHCTNPQTVAALPTIIEGLRAKGYSFVTLSQWQQIVTGTASALDFSTPKTEPLEPLTSKELQLTTGTTPALPNADLKGGSALKQAGAGIMQAAAHGERMATTFYVSFGVDGSPRVVEELEARDPASFAHALMVAVGETGQRSLHAPRPALPVLLAARALNPSDPPAASAPAPAPAKLPKPTGRLRVICNFHSLEECAALLGLDQIFAAPEPPARRTAVEDIPLASASELPESEVPVPEPKAQPAAPSEPAGPVLPPLQKRKPLPLRIIDLLDLQSEKTAWTPPGEIDSDNFLNDSLAPTADGLYPRASFYFLSMIRDLGEYNAVELQVYTRLAKLSGLLLPTDFSCVVPNCELSYPYADTSLSELDRGAFVDLTVENVYGVMDALKSGKQNVFIVVRPANLHFFIAAHTWAEMNDNMRDFVLFRQMTAGLEYDPAAALAEYWKLPQGVEIGRFTDGRKVALVLYSRLKRPESVAVPPEFGYFSSATIDAGGYLRIAPLNSPSVVVDKSPVILYYEYPKA